MNLYHLVKSNHWLSVQTALLRMYPNTREDLDEYARVYADLKLMIPVESEITLMLMPDEDVTGEPDSASVFGYYADSGKYVDGVSHVLNLEFTPWNEWLGMEIDEQTLNDYKELDILAHSLSEMTLVDFDQEFIRNELEQISVMKQEYDKLSDDDKKKFNIALEGVMEELWDEDDEWDEEDLEGWDGFEENPYAYNSINRNALILFPKPPVYDWLNAIDPEESLDCPELFQHDGGNVYLLDEMDGSEDSLKYLQKNYLRIFKAELFDWCEDEDLWPKKLSWKLFQEWFHFSIQTMVFDAGEDQIMVDEF